MRRYVLSALLLTLSPTVVACSSGTSYVKAPDAALGRVVIYRNGVAYFERHARPSDGELTLTVPADKVDDFLKSLTVVEAKTGKPAPVSYPTTGSEAADADGRVKMRIALPKNMAGDLKLSYVTEAPAWKPSYRVSLGKGGKVDLQAFAIVDNTSGEDWKNVTLGVGASSALSFRFDLRSVRLVHRETLQADTPFAIAPPTGGPAFADGKPQIVIGEIAGDIVTRADVTKKASEKSMARTKPPAPPKGGGKHNRRPDMDFDGELGAGGMGLGALSTEEQTEIANSQVGAIARQLNTNGQQIVVQGFAKPSEKNKDAVALDRANKMREQLIQSGVAAERIVAMSAGESPTGSVRILQTTADQEAKPEVAQTPGGQSDLSPIDTSHFESTTPMTVARGSSAMVSIWNGATDGEVVYLYDAETARGNDTFAFRSVRLSNPTDSALESGPVTVYGAGRFIGEGLSEAIPPKSVAFVPFALDRQVVIEKKGGERDEIAKILTVQRGVFSTELRHIQKTALTITNRLHEKATIYVRHTVPKGFKLTNAPAKFEMLGNAHLFKVEIEAGGKVEMLLEEATPVFRTTDIRSTAGMELVKAYLTSAALDGPLVNKVGDLVKLQTDIANIEQRINSLRDQANEYRQRMDELHAQVVTLKAVKTAGPLMRNLEQKLSEVSDKVSKATVDIVSAEESLMVSRIQFQDRVAELTLENKDEKVASK